MPIPPRRRSRIARLLGGAAMVLGGLAAAAACAPYLYAEFAGQVAHERIGPPPAALGAGRWVDDYYVVEQLDSATYAIGEPRHWQGNYSYLLLGRERAILFDAGTGARDLVPVVRALTALPVTVVPSHLHFDHVGALGRFEQTALLDAAPLRSRLAAGRLTLSRYEFLGFMDHLPEPSFAVDQWWADGAVIELGGRQVTVLATPGHTPDSLSLYDLQRRQLYTGDFLYPGHLYAHLPGASLRAYRATAHRLLALIDPATRLYTAHMADPPALPCAPVLEVADLAALARTLDEIAAGTRAGTAFYPRQYPVRGAVSLYTGLPWPAR